MGCFSSRVERIVKSKRNVISEADEDKDFFILSSNGVPQNIDDPITIIEDISLNPLCLALWMGKVETFKIVKDVMGGSLECMDQLLEKQGTSAFEIVLEKGHLEFLKYYLPLFLMSCSKQVDLIEILLEPLVHIAVFHKHLEVVKYIFEYFRQVCPPPAFDLNYVNPVTGENSALIACKNLDIEMARFLYENCEVNFHLVNKNLENSLFLCAYNSSKVLNAYEFVDYLVNTVGINADYRREEILELFIDDRTKQIVTNSFVSFGNGAIDDSFSMVSFVTNTNRGENDEDISAFDILL